jgi:hypothetical protein
VLIGLSIGVMWLSWIFFPLGFLSIGLDFFSFSVVGGLFVRFFIQFGFGELLFNLCSPSLGSFLLLACVCLIHCFHFRVLCDLYF